MYFLKMYIRTNSGDAQLVIAYKCLIKHFYFSLETSITYVLYKGQNENLIHKSLCMNRKDKSSLSDCNIKHKSRKFSHAQITYVLKEKQFMRQFNKTFFFAETQLKACSYRANLNISNANRLFYLKGFVLLLWVVSITL